MGVTKTTMYNTNLNRLAVILKVLGHPARLAIIQHIINQKACICTDLVEELGLAQATISQHLKELKSIGILKGTIEGKSICYCIEESIWNNIKSEIEDFLDQDTHIKSCC